MILEKDYAVAYWLECQLTDEEFKVFTENIEQINNKHLIQLIDGVDEEGKSICFKFNNFKPDHPTKIKWAKAQNEKSCKRFMQLLSKKIDGRLYFNVNHNVIKHKWNQ